MGFERKWDAACLKEYDNWEHNGVRFVVKDLLPEDEDRAIDILVEHLCPDETMCKSSDIINDPISMKALTDYWRKSYQQRTSLGCYADVKGKMTLIALNVCTVVCKGEKDEEEEKELNGNGWILIYKTMKYFNEKKDPFEYLNVDQVLEGRGLVVMKGYRGAGIGARILAAREPLCKSLGVKGTATIFTGIASQKCAERCGFVTIMTASLKELADAGIKHPREDKIIKFMVKKYEN